MKAARVHGLNKIQVEEMDRPACPNDGIVVKVLACGICGSDLRILAHGNKRVQYPAILGHEICAEVIEIGESVSGYQIGDRLAIGADVPCGTCEWCLSGNGNCCDINYAMGHQFSGGFTQYCVLNSTVVNYGPIQKIPADFNPAFATVAEPLACCINGFERVLFEPGHSVLIFGSGPIGALLCLLAKAWGASKVILADINPERLTACQFVQADHFLNSAEDTFEAAVLELTNGKGIDRIFTACPSIKAQEQAIRLIAKRGHINLFAALPLHSGVLQMDPNALHYKEATLTGSHGSTPAQFKKAVELITNQKISLSNFITHQFSLDDIQKGIDTIKSQTGLKVVVLPNTL